MIARVADVVLGVIFLIGGVVAIMTRNGLIGAVVGLGLIAWGVHRITGGR